MTDWQRLGSRDEVIARAPYTVKLERQRIAVFQHDGRFHAISNVCNHKGGPLCEGRMRDEFVTCPWHGWRFDVCTGVSPVIPTAKVEKVECVVEGNDIKVKLNGA